MARSLSPRRSAPAPESSLTQVPDRSRTRVTQQASCTALAGTVGSWATRAAAIGWGRDVQDRKSTRLNSSHGYISYAVFCFKKKKKKKKKRERETDHEW